MHWASEPVNQPQLNVVLIQVTLVMVSVHSSKTLTKTVIPLCIYKECQLVHGIPFQGINPSLFHWALSDTHAVLRMWTLEWHYLREFCHLQVLALRTWPPTSLLLSFITAEQKLQQWLHFGWPWGWNMLMCLTPPAVCGTEQAPSSQHRLLTRLFPKFGYHPVCCSK